MKVCLNVQCTHQKRYYACQDAVSFSSACEVDHADNDWGLLEYVPITTSGRSRPSDRGGWGGHPDTEIRGGPVSKTIFFSP